MSSDKQESSVLFSLKELMNLEEDRVRQEADDKQRQIDEVARQREEDERRRREEEEARMRSEEQRRLAAERERRAEETRLDAIRQGEIEKKRMEAEKQAQLEAMRLEQEKQIRMKALDEDQHKKKLRTTLVVLGISSFLLIGGGVGYYVGVVMPAQRLQAAQIAAAQQRSDELQQQVTDLLNKLSHATDPAEMKRLQDQLSSANAALTEAKSEVSHPKVVTGGGGPRPGGGTASPGGGSKKNCAPNDPMCGL